MLRIGFVPGVSPDKWFHRWAERHPAEPLQPELVQCSEQRAALLEDRVELCFVRLPIDRTGLHLIPLYREVAVVVAAKDHEVTVFEELELKDLADENLLTASDHPEQIEAALDLVQAGVGLLLLPQSLARQHNRKELRHRPVLDAPGSDIGLAWLVEREEPEIEEFIGVVRGRTANSSRQEPTPPSRPEKQSAKKSSTQPGSGKRASRQRQPRKGGSGKSQPRGKQSGRSNKKR
ncbi:LysR family transcriptional regulator substrate-binding protein [Psychromicrobium sp. YIM B11713]|uniref:LysR family transcriptional regulator substrate-binding protein n=1 Tax=Psychromicrobium sp. YIM B11713 TaxID=3145233 RepID=UPI00374EDF6B